MMRVKTYLAMSKIHGVGLFAAEDIPRDTIVWTFDPKFDLVFQLSDLDSLSEASRFQVDKYAFYDKYLKAYVLCGDDARFFNHANSANCLDDVTDYRNTRAIRDILKDEELTADYRQWEPVINI